MGKISTATFSGASGKKYDFTVYTTDTNFNDISAVYIFTKRTVTNNKGSHRLLYIGETGELGTRISNHEKWDCVNGEGCNCICTHPEKDNQTRLDIETDLRKANDTPCNDQ